MGNQQICQTSKQYWDIIGETKDLASIKIGFLFEVSGRTAVEDFYSRHSLSPLAEKWENNETNKFKNDCPASASASALAENWEIMRKINSTKRLMPERSYNPRQLHYN